jgi:putative transposase
MIKAHKVKLNPTPEQVIYFMKAAGIARFAWNWALTEYKRRKAAGEEVDWNDLKKQFRAKIDTEFPFVREVTKCAAEQAINDLRQAIKTYYKAKESHPKSKIKFPGFRKRSRKIGGFGLNNDKFSTVEHTVRVPKLGDVNMTETVRFNGQVMSGRIKEQAGKWYLIVTVKVEPMVQPVVSAHRSIGIDFGLSTFATLSNGEKSETQAPYRQAQGKLKKLQRALARKKKGSKNRAKQKLKVARAHERVANLRNDFLHKFTRKVVNGFSIICVETLSLKGLVQTRLAKSFHDAGIGKAMDLLEYKSKEQGGIVQKVGRFFPSSKRCHVCGCINHDLELSDRDWTCPQCGTMHDRDGNASVNLEMEGVSLLVGSGSLDVTTVEFAASELKLASI